MIEDEFAVLLMIEDMLAALGHELAGTASRIGEALRLVQEGDADVALLDVNIAGRPVDPVAEALAARGVPIVFSTGYGGSGLAGRWRDYPVLQKPYRIGQLQAALSGAAAAGVALCRAPVSIRV